MAHHEWGWMIVVYLFLGGLGAGALVLSAVASITRRQVLQGIARLGALVAPILVGVGTGILVFDLGKPFRSWKLFTTLNPVSPMSIGSWLLTIFLAIAAVHALLHLPPSWLEALAPRSGPLGPALRKLAAWNRTVPETEQLGARRVRHAEEPVSVGRLRGFVSLLCVPLGLSVGIYTGVLLGAIPARPFWNTPMVAQLFLFSALSTASALLLLLLPLARGWAGEGGDEAARTLLRVDLIFMFLELFLIIPFVIHGELSVLSAREALGMIMGGPYTLPFWGGVVALGILFPMLLEATELVGASHRLPKPLEAFVRYGAPLLVLFGGYLLRWVFVHAGQDTWFV